MKRLRHNSPSLREVEGPAAKLLAMKDSVLWKGVPPDQQNLVSWVRSDRLQHFIGTGSPIFSEQLENSLFIERCFDVLSEELGLEKNVEVSTVPPVHFFKGATGKAIVYFNEILPPFTIIKEEEYRIVEPPLDNAKYSEKLGKRSKATCKYLSGKEDGCDIAEFKSASLPIDMTPAYTFYFCVLVSILLTEKREDLILDYFIQPWEVQTLLLWLFETVKIRSPIKLLSTRTGEIVKVSSEHETMARILDRPVAKDLVSILQGRHPSRCRPALFLDSEQAIKDILDDQELYLATNRDNETKALKISTRLATYRDTSIRLKDLRQPYTSLPNRDEIRFFEEKGGRILQTKAISGNTCRWIFATLLFFKHSACVFNLRVSKHRLTAIVREVKGEVFKGIDLENWAKVEENLSKCEGTDLLLIQSITIRGFDLDGAKWGHSLSLVIDMARKKYFIYDPHMYDQKEDHWNIDGLVAEKMERIGFSRFDLPCPLIAAQSQDEFCAAWSLYFMCTLIVNFETISHVKDPEQAYRDIQHVMSYKGLNYFLWYMYDRMGYWFQYCQGTFMNDAKTMHITFSIARHQTLRDISRRILRRFNRRYDGDLSKKLRRDHLSPSILKEGVNRFRS